MTALSITVRIRPSAKFAVNVMGVENTGAPEDVALKGIEAMRRRCRSR